MALPDSAIAPGAGAPFGSDLHSFLAQYEREYPQEVIHIEEPLRAEWEITALAMKMEKAHRFPLLVFHNVIVDGERATMPLTTFLMASRLRLARAMGTEVQKAGLACYERVQTRQRPIVIGRDQAPADSPRCAIIAWIRGATSPKAIFSLSTAIRVSTIPPCIAVGWPTATRSASGSRPTRITHTTCVTARRRERIRRRRTGSVIIRWRCWERPIT